MEAEYIKLNLESNMYNMINKLCMTKFALLSFQLKEKELNIKSGVKIIKFLNELKQRGIKFKISRPLPKCLFGLKYDQIIKEFNIPKNCFECKELFTIEKDMMQSCDMINKKGPKIYYMPERRQIWEYFNILKMEKQPVEKCKKCLYFKRKQCECFVINNKNGNK